jgi:hypothetical protein
VFSRAADGVSNALWWLFVRFNRRVPAVFLVLLFVAKFSVDGALGLDFGGHWDEWYHVQGVLGCVQRMSLMPDALSYGGPYFTLGFPIVAAHEWKQLLAIVRDMRTQPGSMDPTSFPSVHEFKTATTALLGTGQYVLQVRGLFLAVSSLSILWVFLAALKCWPRRYGAALAGAGFVAFSWEIGYHARWIAIDVPLTQFCALELFFFCGAWRAWNSAATTRWFCAAAAAAGAVFACKLTGLFAVLPIIVTPFLRPGYATLRARTALAALGVAVFILVSFALSPEFYVDPLHFFHVIRSGTADYNTSGPSYPFYVGFLEHALRLLLWFYGAVPSPFVPVAALFSVVGLVGFATLLRRDTRMTLAWLAFMVSFIFVFAHNHLMIVRQYLMCTPFLALCFARGSAVVWDFLRLRDRRLAGAFVLVVAGGFLANAVFESRNAWRVTRDTLASVDDAAAADLLADARPVRLSPPVRDRLSARLGAAYTCHKSDLKDKRVTHFIAYQSEHAWMTNRLGAFRKVYGAPEVNLDYYSSWSGRSLSFRLVDVSMDVMTKLGREMAGDFDCFPTGQPGPRPGPSGAAGAGGGRLSH